MQVRKKWTKDEIGIIVDLKNKGMQLKIIGSKFNVTANAIRKALQRHSPMYQKQINMMVDPKYATYEMIINWGLEKNIINIFDLENCSKVKLIMKINRFRLDSHLPLFFLRELYFF